MVDETLRHATRLVFACDATRRLFAALDGPERLRRIYYGLDVDAIDAFMRRRSRDEVRAMHKVERVRPGRDRRGDDLPPQGPARLPPDGEAGRPSGAARTRFYVVGTQPGDYLDQLERFARDERLESVVFVEKTPDVYEYFRMSDVFVCPSRNESLPLVVLEAMAFGLPIVSTDVFGVPEAVAHEREALLVRARRRRRRWPPASSGSSATRALAARLGAHARATLVERFTLERMIDEYDRLMAECVSP